MKKYHIKQRFGNDNVPDLYMADMHSVNRLANGGGGKGGGGGDTQTIQKADPWSGVQPYLRDLYSRAGAQSQIPFQQFPGQMYVDRDPLEDAAQAARLNYGLNAVPGQIGQAQFAQSQMLNAPNLESNPYVLQRRDALADYVTRDLNERIMPSIRSSAIQAGQFGGSRQGIAEGIAARGAQDTIARETSNLLSDAYSQGLQQQARGLTLSPQTLQMGFIPSDVAASVGAYRTGERERALGEAMGRYDFPQQEPWDRLNRLNAILTGAPGGTTSSSTSTGSNTAANVLGGALTGLGTASFLSGAGSGLFGGTPTFAGLGSAGTLGLYGLGGALLGGLLG